MNDWRSYDAVAEPYDRIQAPRVQEPARDLLRLADLAAGDRLLDVGTGTGVLAALAAELGAMSVGVDPSERMLSVGQRARPRPAFVGGEAIDLPFRDATFDVVAGNFVLASFVNVQTALFDVLRVLRPGGRVAFSTWADGRDAFTTAWLDAVDQVIPRTLLEPSLDSAYPNRDRFRRRAPLEETLIDAGLRHVRTEMTHYDWYYGRDEYVESLALGATGRFVRSMLGQDGWDALLKRVHGVFEERFPDPLHDTRRVLLSLGVKS